MIQACRWFSFFLCAALFILKWGEPDERVQWLLLGCLVADSIEQHWGRKE